MYRPYYNRPHHRTYSMGPYEERQVHDSQRRLNSLFQSRISPRMERIMNHHYRFTRPWSPYDRWENQALPSLLPSSGNLTHSVYPDPSPDYHSIETALAEEQEEQGEVEDYPDAYLNDSAVSGSYYYTKDHPSDPRNDSGFGSTSDTPTSLPRGRNYTPLASAGNGNPPIKNCTAASNSKDFIPLSSSAAAEDEGEDGDSDDEDTGIGQLFTEDSASSAGPSENHPTDTSNKPSVMYANDPNAYDVKIQKRFFKCDLCDFKVPNSGLMQKHFRNSLHTSAAEIMGSQVEETFHCKSIIDPAAVHMHAKDRTGVSDLAIMCPICFKYFSTMYLCAKHAVQEHGENVYGVGKVTGQHSTYIPMNLQCLCNEQFINDSTLIKHMNTCKHFQTAPQANISFLHVCPFCFQIFIDFNSLRSHIRSEGKKHKVPQIIEISTIHVEHPTIKKPMLPYACGPLLQDTSETRVIYPHDKKKAMKAWRKNKNVTLGAYHKMNSCKKAKLQ
ncbi:zinc finger and BTB domain-containing protein 17-like [Saccostrea cucullata]|uniref:zinc finger and BTB domain-containing protein 17-like n=1 Tax=Saccostrea cuccullata TaxID=36930 RepID=UPI002ED68E32